MFRNYWRNIVLLILWALMIIILYTLPTKAQDNPTFGISACYEQKDTGVSFSFSNIPDEWLGLLGWYYIGEDVQLEDHTLTVQGLQFDNGYSYAIVGSGDSMQNFTATTEITPACMVTPIAPQIAANAHVAINTVQPISQPAVSTGRTCIIQYPKIILVCNG